MPIQLKPLLSPLAQVFTQKIRPLALITALGLATSGCQSLLHNPEAEAARQAELQRQQEMAAEKERLSRGSVAWSQLQSGQQLSSYRFHNDHQGLSSLLAINNQQDWRHWQEASLPEYDLWDRLRENFAMDISSQDPRVQAQLN